MRSAVSMNPLFSWLVRKRKPRISFRTSVTKMPYRLSSTNQICQPQAAVIMHRVQTTALRHRISVQIHPPRPTARSVNCAPRLCLSTTCRGWFLSCWVTSLGWMCLWQLRFLDSGFRLRFGRMIIIGSGSVLRDRRRVLLLGINTLFQRRDHGLKWPSGRRLTYSLIGWECWWQGPIYTLWQGRNPTIVISDPAIAQELMEKRSQIYSSRPRMVVMGEVFTNNRSLLTSPYNDHWRRLRKLYSP